MAEDLGYGYAPIRATGSGLVSRLSTCPAQRPAPTTRRDAMRFRFCVMAAVALGLGAGSAGAQDKVLAIVVKGLDNPFFEQIHLGCEKANGELKGTGYTCLYTGPASSADEAGEV